MDFCLHRMSYLTLLGPQSHFGDKLLGIGLVCPEKRDCGSKRVNTVPRNSSGPSIVLVRASQKHRQYSGNRHYY